MYVGGILSHIVIGVVLGHPEQKQHIMSMFIKKKALIF